MAGGSTGRFKTARPGPVARKESEDETSVTVHPRRPRPGQGPRPQRRAHPLGLLPWRHLHWSVSPDRRLRGGMPALRPLILDGAFGDVAHATAPVLWEAMGVRGVGAARASWFAELGAAGAETASDVPAAPPRERRDHAGSSETAQQRPRVPGRPLGKERNHETSIPIVTRRPPWRNRARPQRHARPVGLLRRRQMLRGRMPALRRRMRGDLRAQHRPVLRPRRDQRASGPGAPTCGRRSRRRRHPACLRSRGRPRRSTRQRAEAAPGRAACRQGD